ncbi:MAG: hypothetical protein Q9220_005484 [cf. Caloplaca sp. 1 TL-2023]
MEKRQEYESRASGVSRKPEYDLAIARCCDAFQHLCTATYRFGRRTRRAAPYSKRENQLHHIHSLMYDLGLSRVDKGCEAFASRKGQTLQQLTTAVDELRVEVEKATELTVNTPWIASPASHWQKLIDNAAAARAKFAEQIENKDPKYSLASLQSTFDRGLAPTAAELKNKFHLMKNKIFELSDEETKQPIEDYDERY